MKDVGWKDWCVHFGLCDPANHFFSNERQKGKGLALVDSTSDSYQICLKKAEEAVYMIE